MSIYEKKLILKYLDTIDKSDAFIFFEYCIEQEKPIDKIGSFKVDCVIQKKDRKIIIEAKRRLGQFLLGQLITDGEMIPGEKELVALVEVSDERMLPIFKKFGISVVLGG